MIPFSCALERNLADLSPDEAAKYCEENKVQRLVHGCFFLLSAQNNLENLTSLIFRYPHYLRCFSHAIKKFLKLRSISIFVSLLDNIIP